MEEPDFSSGEVAQQFLIVLIAHVARPDDFGMINIGGVINPLPIYIVTRAIAHDHEVLAGRMLQFVHYGCTIQISSWPCGLDLYVCGCGGDAHNYHGDCDKGNYAEQGEADWPSMPST